MPEPVLFQHPGEKKGVRWWGHLTFPIPLHLSLHNPCRTSLFSLEHYIGNVSEGPTLVAAEDPKSYTKSLIQLWGVGKVCSWWGQFAGLYSHRYVPGFLSSQKWFGKGWKCACNRGVSDLRGCFQGCRAMQASAAARRPSTPWKTCCGLLETCCSLSVKRLLLIWAKWHTAALYSHRKGSVGEDHNLWSCHHWALWNSLSTI